MTETTLFQQAHKIFHDQNLSPSDRVAGFIDNMVKDPDAWRTGDDPATGAQLSYLETLAGALRSNPDLRPEIEELMTQIHTGMISKSDAAKKIEEFRTAVGLPVNSGRMEQATTEEPRGRRR